MEQLTVNIKKLDCQDRGGTGREYPFLTEKKLIILVDDSITNLFVGEKSLGAKYTVTTAPSAKLLFSFLENNTPDLILLVVEMPEMDGFEIHLKEEGRHAI